MTTDQIEVAAFWVVTLCSDVIRYKHSGRSWRWRQHGRPKHWHCTTSLHSVTVQKTTICIIYLLS